MKWSLAIVAAAVLAVGLWSATILIRSVLRPLSQLRAGALEGQPEAVRAVGVSALDEIGDVARAFDQVHGELLRLAATGARAVAAIAGAIRGRRHLSGGEPG